MTARPPPAVPAAGGNPGAAPPGLVDRLRAFRSRMIADPGFRRLAARFPLTRRVARRETAALFDLCAGFVYAQVLSAFVRLGLVDLLAAAPSTPEEVARASGLATDRADRLLRAAAALRLAEPRGGGRYGLGPLGAALVGNDGVRAMIEHHALLYEDLADPLALLRGSEPTRLSSYWAYGASDPAEADAYSRLMARSQAFVAGEVLHSLPLADCRSLVDVGGGVGAFVEAAARRHPRLALTLFDLPAVADLARDRLSASGLAHRVEVVGGSFLSDPIPAGRDVVTLVRVLHDHDDGPAVALLSAIRRSLSPGGRLVIAEPMAGTPGAEASGDAYFGFYLLAMRQGRPRRFAEIAAMARSAGFGTVREVATSTPLIVRIAVATT